MTKLVQTLERKKGFSETESVIASYLLKNFRQLPTMSTRQLARATFCSPAAIVRFCQKLGFGGYTEFRVKFLAEMLQNVENPKILDYEISAGSLVFRPGVFPDPQMPACRFLRDGR